MSGLYAESRHITESLARSYVASHDIPDVDIDDLVQVILSRVLSRYRRPGYRIHSFSKVLHIEVVHELTRRNKGPKAALLKSILPLDEEPVDAPKNSNLGDRRKEYFNEICNVSGGTGIILALRRAESYKAAIREIDGCVPRQWIYDHGVQLHYVYRVMHGKGRGT